MVAGGDVAAAVVDQRRLVGAADLGRVAAARWKRQPVGGVIGLGTSPTRTIRSRRSTTSGSGIGTAESSASVYGCTGRW